MNRYHPLATYWRHRFGERVQKIPLDAGFTCPNRDGTISTDGCSFCNPSGSGSGMGIAGMNLKDQWAFWREKYNRKRNAGAFIAYLQSFSNTYGPLSKLKETLSDLAAIADVRGLSIGTRPDCVDQEKLQCIAKTAREQQWKEVWVEYGLQSAHDRTLKRINRGHDFLTFANATIMTAEMGLKVCAHVIAGLPGETADDFLQTVNAVNALPIAGIKFHSLYVADNTLLADEWRCGGYIPLAQEEYIELIAKALTCLRPEIVVQRLTGDASEGELLAPHWQGTKRDVIAGISRALEAQDAWQGKMCGQQTLPLWFSMRQNLPATLHKDWDTQYTAVAKKLGLVSLKS